MLIPKVYALYDKQIGDRYSEDYYDPMPPQCKVYENVLLEPLKNVKCESGAPTFVGGVCHEDGSFIAGYYRAPNTRKFQAQRYIYDSYTPDGEVETLNGEFIYGGILVFTAFGHFVTDDMTRLWYVAKYVADHPENKSKIFFFSENNRFQSPTVENLFWSVMDLLNIDRERVFIVDKIYKAEKVYVPDQSFSFYEYNTDEAKTIYRAIADAAIARTPDGKKYNTKVYLASRSGHSSDFINTEYFEEFYRKRGYDIIDPAELPFDEQVRVAAYAEELVAAFGSIHFWHLFSKDLKKLTLLLRESFTELFYHNNQSNMIQTMQQSFEFNIVDISMNYLPTVRTAGTYLLGPTKYWKQYLDENGYNYTADELEMNWAVFPEYISSYLDFHLYRRPKMTDFIKNQDYFDLINRLSMIENAEVLSRGKMRIKSKPDYDKEIKSLNDQIEKLKSNDQKLLEIQNEFDLAKKDSEEKLLAARNEFELEQKANEEKLLAVKNELELAKKDNEEKLLAVKSDLELAKRQAYDERYNVHIPESLKIITPDKKKVKALYLNCGERLFVNDVECNMDDILHKLSKKYDHLNKQWKSLLGIAYAYMFERKYDMIFKTLENDSISLSNTDISRLGKSSVDVVFDDVIRLDDTVEKHCTDEFGSEIFELMVKALEKLHPEHSAQAKEFFNANTVYSCSAFIMKKKSFNEYAEWVLPVLNEISSNITSKEMQLLPRMADMLLTAYFRMNSDRYVIGTLK